jgi:hypothetical protein
MKLPIMMLGVRREKKKNEKTPPPKKQWGWTG